MFIHSGGGQPEEAVRRDQEMPSNHLLLPPRPRPQRPPVGQSVAIAAREGYGPEGRDGHRLRLSCARLGATRLIMLQPTTTLHQSLRPCAGVRSTRVILVWYHQKILMERGAIIVLGRAVDPGSLSPPPPLPSMMPLGSLTSLSVIFRPIHQSILQRISSLRETCT